MPDESNSQRSIFLEDVKNLGVAGKFIDKCMDVLGKIFVFGLCAMIPIGLIVAWAEIGFEEPCRLASVHNGMPRHCACELIQSRPAWKTARVMKVTGITDLSDREKRVEFDWRYPTSPGSAPDGKSFEKLRLYDDGWRVDDN